MTSAKDHRCVECGAEVSGRYCAQCGEAATPHDYSLKHAFEELVEVIAHVDGRVFSSFRALIFEPGRLAANFLAGRRRSQMGPAQLFLVCNVIYFLLQPYSVVVPFTSTLRMQTENRPWSAMARAMVEARLKARHMSVEAYSPKFDETTHLQAKTLVILMVPLFAVGAWALYGRTRRFYAEHVVFAFYALAFMLLWIGVSGVIAWWPLVRMIEHQWSGSLIETLVSLFVSVPFAIYLYPAALRTYGEPRLRTLVKTVLLSGWAVAVLTIYRFILFFTTFYAT
jgi:hypothetical protein